MNLWLFPCSSPSELNQCPLLAANRLRSLGQHSVQKRSPTKGILFEARYLILISRCALHLALFPSVCDLSQTRLVELHVFNGLVRSDKRSGILSPRPLKYIDVTASYRYLAPGSSHRKLLNCSISAPLGERLWQAFKNGMVVTTFG